MPLVTTQLNNVLDSRFGAGAAAVTNAPAAYYIGLSTTTPTVTGGNVTEPTGNGYAVVAVTNNATNFPPSAGGAKVNGVAIVFPTATGSWGTVTYVIFKDGASGSVVGFSLLATPRTIATGAVPTLAAGSILITAA
jgi:hypothetical protein